MGSPITRKRILDAAECSFAERGYAGTTLRHVAERVEIRIPSLYNHFPNKESLYTAVLARGLGPILELLSDFVEAGEEAYQDPRQLIEQLIHLLEQRPNVPKLVQYELLAGGEHLTGTLGDWLHPTFERGLALLHKTPAARRWKPEQLPLLLLAIYHIVIGNFSIRPLYEALNDEDLVSKQALAKQTEFISTLVMRLLVDPLAGDEASGSQETAPTGREDETGR